MCVLLLGMKRYYCHLTGAHIGSILQFIRDEHLAKLVSQVSLHSWERLEVLGNRQQEQFHFFQETN